MPTQKEPLTRSILFLAGVMICLLGVISPPLALATGIAVAIFLGQPFPHRTPRWTKILLQASVTLLGFGMNLQTVLEAGRKGFWFTACTIAGTLLVGLAIGRLLKVEKQAATLISSGTAICGGSAIAAVGAVLNADREAMSVALGTVFVLNAVALFIFPALGHAVGLSQEQFGLWAAIAIHDTSSVVGAAAKYGDEALKNATTVKLMRALWIVPLTIAVALAVRKKGARIAIPWFILYFLLAAGARTLWPDQASLYGGLVTAAKLCLTLTLFLIGTGLTAASIKKVGAKAMVQGIMLWILVSAAGLAAILNFGAGR